MEQELSWLGLSKIDGITHKQIETFLKLYKKPENIWKTKMNDLIHIGITQKQCEQIKKTKYQHLENEMKFLNKLNIKFITINNNLYPQQLKNIYDFPYWLYIRGNEKIIQKNNIAIIGSRNCSLYGSEVARKLAYQISNKNRYVVSGMARGIDSHAHIGAINANKQTIAVLRVRYKYNIS